MLHKILLTIFLYLVAIKVQSQHNVILIIADDLGTDYCGFYEDHADTAPLPNLRRLLPKAVRFTNGMSNPVCSPTRSGILTGRYSFRTGVGDAVGGVGAATLDTSEKTIPRILKQNISNIATANVGKWHLHNQTPASNLQIPNLMGYDYYAGNFLGALNSYTNWTKITNGISTTSTNYATTETTDDAIAWIKTKNTSPFFLWLAYNAPHTPLHLPPANLHTYTGLTGTANDINANPKKYFKAMLQALDHEIGRLFDSLILYNKFDSTDIIFIGDNGNGIRSAQIANTDRAKGTVYQYGVHVPFIISGPSIVNPNRVSTQLVNTHDLFATIIDLFSINNWQQQIPSTTIIDSKSILPILKNNDTAIRPWAFTEIFKVTTDSADGKAMRNKDYKLIKFDYGAEEFYNLKTDTLETNNLLLNSLDTIAYNNYMYLCTQMGLLTNNNTFCKTVTLPLQFANYNLQLINELHIKNIWATHNETNVSHFNILKSNNGKDFITIGKVNARNKEANEYSFIDDNSQLTIGTKLYYKIAAVDKDGKTSYSETKLLTINNKLSTINIYPNPATSIVTIESNNVKELLIVDYLGKIIYTDKTNRTSYIVNLKSFAKGVYIVKVILNNGDVKTEKLIVE